MTPPTLLPGGRHAQWRPTTPPGWVLLDLDGTLVGPAGAVTDPVRGAIEAVVAAGVRVGYATGRNVAGVDGVHGQLGLAGPHVVLNGAQVREAGRALHTWSITDDQLAAILRLCAEEGHYAELYTDDGVLVTAMDRRYQPHWDEVIGWPIGTLADHPPAPGAVIKATIVTHDEPHTAAVVAAVRALGLSAGAATSPVTPGLTYVNITRADVDKGTAVTATAQTLGIPLSAVVAIGDGANDESMLRVAGTAIAMGDASPELVDVAHLVTAGVAEDGVAVALLALLPDSAR